MTHVSLQGPGWLMFFQDFESEIEQVLTGGSVIVPPEKEDFKKEDDDFAIALSLLLARRL